MFNLANAAADHDAVQHGETCWTRIKAIDCEVISDVPKAIQPAEGE